MATKTANLYAKIEPETKTLAEGILDTLGIPVSTAINMFFKQIILNKGLPFEAKIPQKKTLSIDEMTKEQFIAELEKGFQCIENGDVISVEDAFSSLKTEEKIKDEDSYPSNELKDDFYLFDI